MDPSRFGGRLRELRELRQMYQQELAEKSGVGYRSICRIETGNQDPSWTAVCKLADALGVTPDVFLAKPAEFEAKTGKRARGG